DRSLWRRIRNEAVGVEQVATGRVRTPGVFARDHPLRFGDLPFLDLQAKCRDGWTAAFVEEPEISSLSADWIHEAALDLSECGDRLPHAAAGTNDDPVFRLAEPNEQRSARRIVFDDGVQVLVEHVFQTSAIAGFLRGRNRCGNRNDAEHADQSMPK